NAWRVDWRLLKIHSEIKLGNYAQAGKSATEALQRHTGDIRVRWTARHAYRLNNEEEKASLMIAQIDQLVKNSPWRYSDAEDRIVIGKMMLEVNADAKQVLELFFDSAKKVKPSLVDNYLVAADLALSKNDFALAAQEAQAGLKRHPQNAELHFRLARALWGTDREPAIAALTKTLELNPSHCEALLFQSERAIDQEDYAGAEILIEKILKINARQELAFAHKAIIAHLRGDYAAEKLFRQQALSSWAKNPRVDHTIGRKLSQKYRFREGAAYQKLAIEFSPDFVPAKIQLAQDLLRLGREEEGWELVAETNKLDAYNVLMHNLQTLHDEISSFAALEKDGIIVRMSAREARLYGPEVLSLLTEAKAKLTQKYDYQFDQPVIVEIFPRQSDFAIRTFGMPGGAGFLGVCFGHLITANSPASQGENPTNWKSVLWHEFCHAVTLGKTQNRMPRWLSEGISVYEERLRNPGSGEKISPTYRKIMLSEELTPVSKLSAAFLRAESPIHLQFAYYESSLVIEYLVKHYGIETLKKILVDLGAGISVNESLQRYTGSLTELDAKFKKFVVQVAENYGDQLDFSDADLAADSSVSQIKAFLRENPFNFSATIQLANSLIQQKSYLEAKDVLILVAGHFEDH
ncbi:MAG: tetratricopeptide repeat protein, partial [Planctomycetota bacterium]|nr:tetratricopeptide repeat protein [Planctomycetota bacterium]